MADQLGLGDGLVVTWRAGFAGMKSSILLRLLMTSILFLDNHRQSLPRWAGP